MFSINIIIILICSCVSGIVSSDHVPGSVNGYSHEGSSAEFPDQPSLSGAVEKLSTMVVILNQKLDLLSYSFDNYGHKITKIENAIRSNDVNFRSLEKKITTMKNSLTSKLDSLDSKLKIKDSTTCNKSMICHDELDICTRKVAESQNFTLYDTFQKQVFDSIDQKFKIFFEENITANMEQHIYKKLDAVENQLSTLQHNMSSCCNVFKNSSAFSFDALDKNIRTTSNENMNTTLLLLSHLNELEEHINSTLNINVHELETNLTSKIDLLIKALVKDVVNNNVTSDGAQEETPAPGDTARDVNEPELVTEQVLNCKFTHISI